MAAVFDEFKTESEIGQLSWAEENVIRHGHCDRALSNTDRAGTRVRIEREHALILFAVAHEFGVFRHQLSLPRQARLSDALSFLRRTRLNIRPVEIITE